MRSDDARKADVLFWENTFVSASDHAWDLRIRKFAATHKKRRLSAPAMVTLDAPLLPPPTPFPAPVTHSPAPAAGCHHRAVVNTMTGRWVSFTHVGTGALLCALLLQAAVLAIGVLPVAGEAGHSGVEEMIEDYDTNTSGGLDVDELAELLEALVDDPTARGDCPDAATLLAASDADSSGELSGEELEHAASELMPCLASLQTIESVHVTVEGKTFVCTPPGGAHDEHEHEHEDEDHRRVLTMPVPATALTPAQRVRRLAVPDVDAGGSEWECVEEAAEEAEEGHLPTGTVWLYSIIASVVSGLCSVAGIVFMLPAVMVRNNGVPYIVCFAVAAFPSPSLTCRVACLHLRHCASTATTSPRVPWALC